MIELDSLIAVPIIWTPDTSQQEIEHEVNKMIYRSQVAAKFLDGELTFEDYLDCLNDQRIDAFLCVDDWIDGISYI